MTLHQYARVVRERWLIVVSTVVLGLVVAGATWFLRPPEYTAVLRMYVSAQSTDTTQAAYQGAQLSQQRVTSYVELVTSPRVSAAVIQQLGLNETPDELAKHIVATSKLDSVVIDVSVQSDTPDTAARIANAIGATFPRLIDELERPSSPTGTPPVVVRVVEPAPVPDKPSSVSLPVSLVIGLLAGLVVGPGLAVFRNAVDSAVKTPDQLRAVTRVPNLGHIAFDAAVPKRPLTVHEDPQSPRSEAFRHLRTSLQFLNVDASRKVIVVTSSMPDEGKTTTLANLAIAVASAGQRVLVVEADLRRPKLADVLGVERSVGLTNVLAGRVYAESAIQHWSGGVFDVLSSGTLPPNPSELLASRQMATLLNDLREQYDLVLLDTPPLLPVTDAAAVAPHTDGSILVCRFGQLRRFQVERAVEALASTSAPLLGTVLTMVPERGPYAYAQYNSYYRVENQHARTPFAGEPGGAAAVARPAQFGPRSSRPTGHEPGVGPGAPRPTRRLHDAGGTATVRRRQGGDG